MPLVGANVVLENTSKGTTSDVKGKFKLDFDKLPVNIKVTYIGFQSKNVTVKDGSFLNGIG